MLLGKRRMAIVALLGYRPNSRLTHPLIVSLP
jgi:hypothetical protein